MCANCQERGTVCSAVSLYQLEERMFVPLALSALVRSTRLCELPINSFLFVLFVLFFQTLLFERGAEQSVVMKVKVKVFNCEMQLQTRRARSSCHDSWL